MRRLPLLVLLLAGFHHTLAATVIVPAEFGEIVAGSQLIVHGRVVDVRSEWVDERSRIESYVTIAPSTFYRGSPTASVTFRTPGGEAGGYRSVIVGAPQFRTGDEAVVFLKTDGPAGPRLFGLNQGLFRVKVDSRSGRRMVARHVVTAHGSAAQRVKRGDPSRQPMTLDAFGALVRSALQQRSRR